MRNLIFLLMFSQIGCATSVPINEPLVDPYLPAFPESRLPAGSPTGSIFADETNSRLFGNKRSFEVGDVLTVILTNQRKLRGAVG